MAHRPKHFLRTLIGLLVTALVTGLSSLILAAPAAARVSIVPNAVNGGGTKTLAFRLANERPDTASTRLELVFPQNVPIAFAEVVPVGGWTAKITARPLNPPIRMGDQVIGQVVNSIVLEGGAVGPREFEQFLITMGPLPVTGRMVFEATQSFANGAVERWTTAAGQPTPGSPMITIGGGEVPGAATPPGGQGEPEPDPAAQTEAGRTTEDSGDGGFSWLLWGALPLGAVVVALAGLQAYRQRQRSERDLDTETEQGSGAAEPDQDTEMAKPENTVGPNAAEVVER